MDNDFEEYMEDVLCDIFWRRIDLQMWFKVWVEGEGANDV